MNLYCKVRQKFIDARGWEGFRDMYNFPEYQIAEEALIDLFFDTVCIYANVVEDKELMDTKKIKIENVTVEKLQDLLETFRENKENDAKKTI